MTSPKSDLPLESFPRPNVAVDTAVLTVRDDVLCVVLASPPEGPRLPGRFIRPGERLADAVQLALQEKVGINGLRPEQLEVFDDPKRDTRGWVLSVAHVDVVPVDRIRSDKAHLIPVDSVGRLPFDHNRIIEIAVESLRYEYARTPDPRALIGGSFTLRDLQILHEAVAGRPLQRETFRKRMERQVEATGETLRGVVGKPPRLFRRKDSAD